MGLLPPAPSLGTDSVTHTVRTRRDAGKGDRPFVAGSTFGPYPAVATMQTAQQAAERNRVGAAMVETYWDVLLFNPTDPGVAAEDLLTTAQGRSLWATAPSTYRGPGAWLVTCKEFR
jgi:hypothetical protein